tara:strand:+ start:268 stop:837 length:570 start_codon:yes stop_codon:yes gene_type:complete
MRLWCRTLRISLDAEMQEILKDASEPMVVVFWHNRLFIAAECCRRFRAGRDVCGLVSASKDGAWLSAFFDLVGIRAIRGSSSYRGAQALREMLQAVEGGADVAITPDGPRGPRYRVKPGAVLVARQAGTSLLVASCKFASAWRLKSWDGFFLPKPFSRVELRCKRIPSIASLDRDEGTAVMQQELDALF